MRQLSLNVLLRSVVSSCPKSPKHKHYDSFSHIMSMSSTCWGVRLRGVCLCALFIIMLFEGWKPIITFLYYCWCCESWPMSPSSPLCLSGYPPAHCAAAATVQRKFSIFHLAPFHWVWRPTFCYPSSNNVTWTLIFLPSGPSCSSVTLSDFYLQMFCDVNF